MKPDLEIVQVREDQSFKIWSHGYPFRTVRWHFHPEYELHLVTATAGNRYVGDHIGAFHPGDLVFIGPNLPHNWISDVPEGETVQQRSIILQFTQEFILNCMTVFPELRFVQQALGLASRGLLFDRATAGQIAPLMLDLLQASDGQRISLFIAILNAIAGSARHVPLASIGSCPDPPGYLSTTMNLVLQYIGRNFTTDLNEAELAKLSRQSSSAFSRSFGKHTGMTFLQYVNSLRVELACQHLSRTDITITDICYEVGFRNVSNFNRHFLSLKGMPPSRFRTLQRAGRRMTAAA